MTAWTADELDRIGTAGELHIAPLQPDGTLRNPVLSCGVGITDVVQAAQSMSTRTASRSGRRWVARATPHPIFRLRSSLCHGARPMCNLAQTALRLADATKDRGLLPRPERGFRPQMTRRSPANTIVGRYLVQSKVATHDDGSGGRLGHLAQASLGSCDW